MKRSRPSRSDDKGKPALRLAGGVDSADPFRSKEEEPRTYFPESRPVAYAEGDLIADKYRLVRQLGEGGMGTVWVAHNESLDVSVAIKLLKTDEESERLAGRLTQEARAAAKLGHPAIMRVFDFGKTAEDVPFIVMELLRGE